MDYLSHYQETLSGHYSWAFGGQEENIEKNREFFKLHLGKPAGSFKAIDLGTGSGFQSIPLAELGYDVFAIDTSSELLREAKQTLKKGKVEFIKGDMKKFPNLAPTPVNLITCMGDTLSHLSTLKEVEELLSNSYTALEREGYLSLSYRDLSNDLKDADRIIPVKADDNCIFTCFLEFEKSHVKVNDIIYSKCNNEWNLNKSSYRKLKISKESLLKKIREVGFSVYYDETIKGMSFIIARK